MQLWRVLMVPIIFFLGVSGALSQQVVEESGHTLKFKGGIMAYSNLDLNPTATGLGPIHRSWNGFEFMIQWKEFVWLVGTGQIYSARKSWNGIDYGHGQLGGHIFTLGLGVEGKIWSVFDWVASASGFHRVDNFHGYSGSDTHWEIDQWDETNKEFGLLILSGIKCTILKYLYIKGQIQLRTFWGHRISGTTMDDQGWHILGRQMNGHLVTIGAQF